MGAADWIAGAIVGHFNFATANLKRSRTLPSQGSVGWRTASGREQIGVVENSPAPDWLDQRFFRGLKESHSRHDTPVVL
jgi:hypothetical protein